MATEPVESLRSREYDALRSLIRELRESKSISQEELSRKLGKSITFMGKVELGTRRIDVIELMQIASALGEDVLKIVGELRSRLNKKS